MKCIECKNFLFIGTHSKHCHNIKFPDGTEYEGYFPPLHNLSNRYSNDDMDIELCVDCGHLKGFDSEKLKKSIEKFLAIEKEKQ